jgi:tetratricopeptide (TPR) repeat protein
MKKRGNCREAAEHLTQAINLKPNDLMDHLEVAGMLQAQGKYDEAVSALQKAHSFFSKQGREQEASRILRYIDFLEFEKSKAKSESSPP